METPPAINATYLVFAAYVDQLAVQRIFAMTAGALREGSQNIHLLMHTAGGNVADGICLYHYFKHFPADLTVYNAGSIMSAGVIAYLGAASRKTAALATFMIHRSAATFQGANADVIQARIASLIMDDERMESILREHVNLSPEQWIAHKSFDIWLDAKQATAAGLATGIGDFAPPRGTTVYNVLQ